MYAPPTLGLTLARLGSLAAYGVACLPSDGRLCVCSPPLPLPPLPAVLGGVVSNARRSTDSYCGTRLHPAVRLPDEDEGADSGCGPGPEVIPPDSLRGQINWHCRYYMCEEKGTHKSLLVEKGLKVGENQGVKGEGGGFRQ